MIQNLIHVAQQAVAPATLGVSSATWFAHTVGWLNTTSAEYLPLFTVMGICFGMLGTAAVIWKQIMDWFYRRERKKEHKRRQDDE